MSVPDEPSERILFNFPGVDLLLHSYDSYVFLVPKLYIINSSPKLGKLIHDASTSSDAAHDEGPLLAVKLPDAGVILHSLLTFIFPVPPILPSTTKEIMQLLSVAQKYEMNSTMTHIRGCIARQDPSFISPENAFYVYSLAQNHGLRQEALQAARATLTISMTIEGLEDKADIISGAALHELWKYHKRVRSVLASDLAEFRKSGAHNTLRDLDCLRSEPSGIPLWLDNYIKSIGTNFRLFDVAEFDIALACHFCGTRPRACVSLITSQNIRTFWAALTALVNGSIEKAQSALSLVQPGVNSQVKSESNRKRLSLPQSVDVPGADLILRSADLVNFRVHKSVLFMASPVFKDLLSLPQPSDSEFVDGLPVVQISEDAEILDYLIPMLYPRPVIPWSENKLLSLLATCEKYEMVSIQSSIRAKGRRRPFGEGAFCIYAIASSKLLIPEMAEAARLTLDYPMTFETLGEGLRLFEGWALRDLIRYRKRCRDNMVQCLESFLEGRTRAAKVWVGCPDAVQSRVWLTKSTKKILPTWLSDILTQNLYEIKQCFTYPLELSSRFREQFLTALRAHAECHFCLKIHVTKEGSEFCDELFEELYRACDKESMKND